jgi:hypothetical protein
LERATPVIPSRRKGIAAFCASQIILATLISQKARFSRA